MPGGQGHSAKRQVRSILPFGGGGKILRFSGRSRSSSQRGTPERRRHDDEDDLYRSLGRIAANWSLIRSCPGSSYEPGGSRDETLARAVVAGQRVENVLGDRRGVVVVARKRHRRCPWCLSFLEEERKRIPPETQRGHPQRVVVGFRKRRPSRLGCDEPEGQARSPTRSLSGRRPELEDWPDRSPSARRSSTRFIYPCSP